MDKRASPRYSVNLNALVHPSVGRSWLCEIQDFCDAGMLLVEQNGRPRRSLPGITAGQNVGIHFSVPGEKGDQHFRLEGSIVRVMDTGVGINFPDGMSDDAYAALSDLSGLEPVPEAPPPAKEAEPAESGETDTKKAAGESRRRGGKPQDASKPAAAAAAKKAGAEEGADKAASTAQPTEDSGASAFLTGGLKPDDAKRVVAMLRKEVVKIIPEMTASLFAYMDSELLELAKDAKSNAEQSEYFAAMSALEKAKKDVSQSILNDVLNQIDHPRDLQTLIAARKKANDERKAQAQERVKLSLVNTEEFEDWLAVANIVSRSERMYENFLSELLKRMGMLVDSWGHLEANPLGTAVITHAFDESIQSVDLNKDIRQKIYSGYEVRVLPLFRQLYISSTRLLEETGLFPDIDEDYVSSPKKAETPEPEPEPEKEPEPIEDEEEIEDEEPVDEDEDDEEEAPRPSSRRRSSRRRSSRRAEPEPPEDDLEDEVEDYEDELEEDFDEPPAAARSSRRRSSRRRSSSAEAAEAPAQSSRQARRKAPARGPSRRAEDVGTAIRNIYDSVRQLLGAKSIDSDGYDGPIDAGEYDDADYFETEEVQDLLSTLEDEIMFAEERVPIRKRLVETASMVGGRAVAPETMRNLEVVENLVDTIEEDEMLTGSAKDWIRQLELTLDKVATAEDDFLSEANPHKSLEVVNQLARLGGVESGSNKRVIDDIVRDINNNYDEDPEVFDRALEQLNPIIERQNRAFTGNVQRTVKASQGQQTLINAQRAVVSEMDQRYAGREVPEVLFKLLMPGWRNLLVNTHLRQGAESEDWRKHVKALDQVFQHLDENSDPTQSPDYMEPEELIEHIEEGLDSISYEPGQRIPLINTLRSVISGQTSAADMPRVALEETSVADSLGFGDINQTEETRQKILEEHSDDSKWQRAYDRAQHLHIGAWVEFLDKEKPEIAIVAWISEDASRLVFVNRRGVKTHDISAEELATMMQQGLVRILEETDIPLTDRASHRMLQNMHNQLTHQATHDDLTGLLNRKEFERELEIAFESAVKEGQTHLCCYLDLDQFKVINNTGGLEAGDTLLKEVAKILTEKLDAQASRIARLGGDEFGLLVEDCSPEIGMTLVKSVADAVKAMRFEWEGDTFSLTTSCGICYIDENTESVTRILSSADAACSAAKEAGRDRIHEYKADDSEMQHRKGIMEFVSTIDRALDEDRFALNCQKIQPIDPDDPDVHYEILLTILDEDDTPLPPQDFIIAAERYNRMGAVDRWVIKNSFEFIASNILKLDHLGAFSINISGNSLTEDDFMEFVLEQFNETKLPTSKICFEITETSAIGSLDDVVDFMERLKIIGVRFSLDDFGTGLSSYSYLRSLPVDYLKIDGVFVKDIKENPSDYAVVKSINEVGHFMGKKTIAEFVEDEEIVEILREIGVDYAQGWGVGKKEPIEVLLK